MRRPRRRASRYGGQNPSVVEKQQHRKQQCGFLRRQRQDPAPQRQEQPRQSSGQQRGPANVKRQKNKRAAEKLRPPADIADGLGQDRVHRKEQRGNGRGTRRAELAAAPRMPAPILASGPDQPREQSDIDHVEQHVRQVKAERLRDPRSSGRARRKARPAGASRRARRWRGPRGCPRSRGSRRRAGGRRR